MLNSKAIRLIIYKREYIMSTFILTEHPHRRFNPLKKSMGFSLTPSCQTTMARATGRSH